MKVLQRVLSVLCIVLFFVLCAVPLASAETTTLDTFKALLETTLASHSYYDVELNESGVVIRVAQDGLANAALCITYGLQDYSDWESFRNVTVDYANSIYELIQVADLTATNCLYMLIDDISMDTTLLAIYNGQVIYDYLPATATQ